MDPLLTTLEQLPLPPYPYATILVEELSYILSYQT
jgi:hypothetical protein